eukprot:Skav208274  [mRNA]  locus=scaffold188:468912:469847:- [translate_table: standard]
MLNAANVDSIGVTNKYSDLPSSELAECLCDAPVNDDSDSCDEEANQQKGNVNIRVHVGPVVGCCSRDERRVPDVHAQWGQPQHSPRVVPPPAKRHRKSRADAETQTPEDPYYMPPNISQRFKLETIQRQANVRYLEEKIENLSRRLAILEGKPVGNPYVQPIEDKKADSEN